MDKTKTAGANAIEARNPTLALELPGEIGEELRILTDFELRLAGGGDDVPNW